MTKLPLSPFSSSPPPLFSLGFPPDHHRCSGTNFDLALKDIGTNQLKADPLLQRDVYAYRDTLQTLKDEMEVCHPKPLFSSTLWENPSRPLFPQPLHLIDLLSISSCLSTTLCLLTGFPTPAARFIRINTFFFSST